MEHPYGHIVDGKIYRKAFLNFPEREIGEVRESPEESLAFFEERFKTAELKVTEIEKQIASNENKGSFLAKLLHMKSSLGEFDGLGDFESLYKRLEAQEQYLEELIRQNRIRNLEVKKGLLQELELLKEQFNLREGTEKIKEIRDKWIRTGSVPPEHQQEIDDAFNTHLNTFFERKKSFFEDRKKMIGDYVKQYKELIARAGDLAGLEGNQRFRRSDEIMREWKNLPRIPSSLFIPLREEFRKTLGSGTRNTRKPVRPDTRINLPELIKEKQAIIEILTKRILNFDGKTDETENLKTKWKNHPRVNDKDVKLLDKKAYDLFNKLGELGFIYTLSIRKNRDFGKLSEEQQTTILIRFLNDMLIREKKDLDKAENNSGIIYSHDRKMQDMLSRQLQTKIRRIETKTALIRDLSDGKIKLKVTENLQRNDRSDTDH